MSDSVSRAWARVEREGERLRTLSLRVLFERDPERFASLSFGHEDLLVDLSREKIDRPALAALSALAEAAGLPERRDALFAGERINSTEDRAVLHMALRDGADARLVVDGIDVHREVEATRDRFLAFAEGVRSGSFAARDGGPFTDVVHIGIGGSHLGPEMAVRALRPDHDGPHVHFVANVDGADLADATARLDPTRTLVLVASKTFTTLETMTNARSARGWLAVAHGDHAGEHMAAISSNVEAAAAFGIEAERVFGFRDWVGGRYSLWSAIGLPVAIAVGAERFRDLLAGAAALDHHFRSAPLDRNLPVLMALVSVWRRNVMGWPSVALIPYDQRLERLPAYVQQLAMESNGKTITREGHPATRATAPVVWGEPGTNAQHSFFQLLHQGTDVVPVDFIVAAQARNGSGAGHHRLLVASCLAQAQALAFGRTPSEVRGEMAAAGAADVGLVAHRSFAGDRPSTTIAHGRLDPRSLGRLIALFEHRAFVEGVLWDVNSFDQWGVELGKSLADRLHPALAGGPLPSGTDSSTAGLLRHLRRLTDG
ncbi:MAG: glucose-6-phosphate isomerase [Immundisolibacterales bacterium]|nr:glucose-6-phosphate isomerase [Immundisolibacterales bacterium]